MSAIKNQVAVIGANGKVARLLVDKLQKTNDFSPLAIIRNKDQVDLFESKGVKAHVVSLTDPVSSIANAIKGSNAVVFSAGAGGKGLDLTFAVDLDGAVKTFEAAESVGIKRFILVSAIGAENRDFWYDGPLRSYYIAKKYADRELRRTKLDWTILQPGLLGTDNGTGKVSGDYTKNKNITRDDVAQSIVEALKQNKTIHKTITLVNGDTSIADYLASAENAV